MLTARLCWSNWLLRDVVGKSTSGPRLDMMVQGNIFVKDSKVATALVPQRQILSEESGPSPVVRNFEKSMPDLAGAMDSKINIIAGSVLHSARHQVRRLRVVLRNPTAAGGVSNP